MAVSFNKTGIINASGNEIGKNLLQGSSNIGATNVAGWINNGSTTLEKIDDVIHFKRTLSNSNYVPTITTSCVAPCNFSTTYVYSMDLKFDRDVKVSGGTPVHFWYGARNTDSIFNTSCNGNLTARSSQLLTPANNTIISANTWFTQRHLITFGAGPTSDGYIYPAIRCFVYGSNLTEAYTGEVNAWMKNCKIEEGNVTTPWIPNESDWGYTGNTFAFIESGDKMSIYPNHIQTSEFIEY